ncbi:MAG TPA: hypothetical protein DEQ87_19360 [Algoriphagus sp.]|jgi:hypothetical protein|uniref:hypothetical protein n=1 Tax=unclassified Algoriphagus TaxID=2641541 RepID=UPI000C443132|nr:MULTISPECIES: hypothetical protein [unclassified Algoriphagus]MAL11981.1 hypothetical protein [Algoriphagus sp.]MAN87393.1 hypothetical protein [Algoriphagus sp.]QYH38602.1 hypothetical protein GYM62_07265 [Algoriphagus sp. NBT04N3]HAH36021.1 hypothetical protein [Algoriphagus sp.]HCD89772.1 hypothetical protein [Algoriphagus sp.]|tara:strand:- start:998 stop:1561 length:564 start_codon:yes stop_codon:yes gene_type:complete
MNNSFEKIFVTVLVLTLSISICAKAQTKSETYTAKNAVYLEVGGSSGRYAINYSKIFHQKGKLKLNASAGFSMWPNRNIDSKTSWLPALPLEISALVGKSNHHLELGMGFTSYLNTSFDFDSETFETINKVVINAFIPLRVGYRYQKPEGGFFFRVGYTPIIDLPPRTGGNWSFNPYWAGVSFGKSF